MCIRDRLKNDQAAAAAYNKLSVEDKARFNSLVCKYYYAGAEIAGETLKPEVDPTLVRMLRDGKLEIFDILDRTGKAISPDGEYKSLDDRQKIALAAGMLKFDMATLRNLEKEGITYIVIDPANFTRSIEKQAGSGEDERVKADLIKTWSENYKMVAGCYKGQNKTISFRNDAIWKSSVIHELGHAIDDLAMPDPRPYGKDSSSILSRLLTGKFLSDADDEVKGLYQDYIQRSNRDPAAVWSEYAKTNVQEYVAEGVKMYYSNEILRNYPVSYTHLTLPTIYSV